MSDHAATVPGPLLARLAESRFLPAPRLAETARLGVRIAGATTVVVCAIGLVVRLTLASWARRWLAFPFAGIPAHGSEAAAIFLHNVRALAAVGGVLLVAQSPYWARDAAPGPVQRTLQRVGEVLLGGAVAANVLVIGASFGAYGIRMVRAALPHGPLELAGFALALALYVEGRRQPLAARHALAVAGLSMSALAVAAVLETFVSV